MAVRIEREVKLRIPIHTLDGIVCFGNVGCSPFLMGFCAEQDVTISFLTEYGRFLARVVGPVSGNVLLRREQYRRAYDPVFSATLARAFISGKVASGRSVLQRALRDHADKIDTTAVEEGSRRLSTSLKRLQGELDLDATRGVEGDAVRPSCGGVD